MRDSCKLPEVPWHKTDLYIGLICSISIPLLWHTGLLSLIHRELGPLFYWASVTIIFVILITVPTFLSKRKNISLIVFNTDGSTILNEILFSLVLFLGLFILKFIVVAAVYFLSGYDPLTIQIIHIESEGFLRTVVLVLVLLNVCVLGPIAEEFFFRGFLYNALKSSYGVKLAILLQTLLYTIGHEFSIYGTLQHLVVALYLVILYERRKTLWSPMLIHILNNIIALRISI